MYQYFSGWFGTSTNQSNYGLNQLYSCLGDYHTIQSGNYKKLLTAYYQKNGSDEKTSTPTVNKTEQSAATTTKEMTQTKKTADGLTKAGQALMGNAHASLYQEANQEELVSTVQNFVSSYNKVMADATESSSQSVKNFASAMKSNTDSYADSLKGIGIELDEDSKLTLNVETLKNADQSSVKHLLSGKHSFVGTTVGFSSQISAAASTSGSGVTTYNATGSYSGLNVNSYFDYYL